ncbi:hypothetical protein D9O36_02860 [Zobellia amurskyensis]|uniref:Uncharacterized protein n=1 Tax=Zobellia amurskyensis TaxID=248905 RepID=A0A7X2ZQZ0_9FLAO|nr:hypothetical protein [Zobellia amurskyensis]MUH34772.1 hypothetical protein [Zobellia amurskyensis]
MSTTTTLGNTIRRPFTANKRLFTLLTVAFIIIGLFFAIYYSHIKNNEHHYRESKLHSLDANFDIITKQLNNDFQKYYSTQYDSIYSSEEVTAELKSIFKDKLNNSQWDSISSIANKIASQNPSIKKRFRKK